MRDEARALESRAATELRKLEHLEIALSVSEDKEGTWLGYARFVHMALPETCIDCIDTSVRFLGYTLSAPIIIEAMTGGTSLSRKVNEYLAKLAEKHRIAMGVGSQRLQLAGGLVDSYRVVREIARDVPVIANIGFAQLRKMRLEDVETLISSIEASALAIHLNPLHELLQPEGDKDFRGVADKIRELIDELSVPIIVKEVGFGLSKEVVEELHRLGVEIFDVAGYGGTNWALIELERARRRGLRDLAVTARTFIEWGIPTAPSIIEARHVSDSITVIASGGLRTGLDIAKAIALGADLGGMARPFLEAFVERYDPVPRIVYELRIAMLLTRCHSIEELKRAPIVLLGKLAEWVRSRGLRLRNPNAYILSQRC